MAVWDHAFYTALYGVMNRASVAVLAVITLAAGIGVGLTFAKWSPRELSDQVSFNQVHANAAAAAILLDTAALVRLKDNDVAGAQSALEAAIDVNLVMLNGFPKERADGAIQRVLLRTAEYRAKYPRKSNKAEIDFDVQNVLNEAARNRK